jgi:hypothetical protein
MSNQPYDKEKAKSRLYKERKKNKGLAFGQTKIIILTPQPKPDSLGGRLKRL